jgi:hypothetical protein
MVKASLPYCSIADSGGCARTPSTRGAALSCAPAASDCERAIRIARGPLRYAHGHSFEMRANPEEWPEYWVEVPEPPRRCEVRPQDGF